MNKLSRRVFLKGAAAILAGASTSLAANPRSRFNSDPFTLGVASGSPLPDGVLLWTRLAPDPIHGGGLDPVPIPVNWEVAADENFHRIVRQGTAVASPDFAHSIHIDVDGLEPAHTYFYRFFAHEAVSPVGRTRTAPARDAAISEVRFAFSSCQQYEQGYYAAHRHMAEEDLDVVFFLGDYIYEISWGANLVRRHEAGEPCTLDEYRNRYALYKTDPDLQLCHARFPWIVTWDDHEVSNDYANDRCENLDPHFLARRAAAYQAYYEHMPLRALCQVGSPDLHIYRNYDFGRLARFHVLDDRQYRNYQLIENPRVGGSCAMKKCADLAAAQRSMLGQQQEAWLAQSLKSSNATWDVIVQQTLMAEAMRPNGTVWTDGWDGYPAARRRLLESTVRGETHNTIVIGGDVHANAVSDLKLDFDDPRSPVVATEFCSTSISSQEPMAHASKRWTADNPHIKYGDGDKRGYARVALKEQQAKVAFRAIADEKVCDTNVYSVSEFTVTNTRPGAQRDA